MASWTSGSRGELTFRDYVCLSSRDVLTERQNDWRNIQIQATLHVWRWAAASALIPGKGDKDSRLSRLRGTFGQLGMASLSLHVPEIALGSSQAAVQACRGFWALIPECRWAL